MGPKAVLGAVSKMNRALIDAGRGSLSRLRAPTGLLRPGTQLQLMMPTIPSLQPPVYGRNPLRFQFLYGQICESKNTLYFNEPDSKMEGGFMDSYYYWDTV